MGALISPAYLEQQKELHEKGPYGITSKRWVYTVSQIAHMFQCERILDYGAGTGCLRAELGEIVAEYDPCLAGKDADPEPADLVVCTDVLEHIEPDCIDAVLSHLASKVKKVLFFAISLTPAIKTLSDGRNAHLILQPVEWWLEKLGQHLIVEESHYAEKDGVAEVFGAARVKGAAPAKTGIRANKARRKLNKHQKKQFEKFFDSLREGSRRYSDPLCAIDTFEFWEGIDDRPADCLMVVDILEHQWDVHAALLDIKRLAKRAALICVRPDFRGKEYWTDLIGRYFVVNEVVEGEGLLSFVGNAKTLIPGAKIVPAGTDASRWANIEAATLKYRESVTPAEPHGRKALIACYGPTLNDTWENLREQSLDAMADVVSVSGSHDFLIQHGITPRFHVECDPRAHKADNIAASCPETEYLLSSTCHPRMFEKVAGAKIRLWHSVDGEPARRIVDELKSTAPIIFGGGSVGLRALPVMYRMGYRKFAVYGMDCSVSDDGQAKWAGPHAQKDNHKDHDLVRVHYNGRYFTTTAILLSYGTDFFDMVNRMMEKDPSLVFEMHGDGLLQARASGPQAPIQILLEHKAA